MEDYHNHHDQEAKEAIISNIEKFGCHLALLEPDNYLPSFAYSIGLYKKFDHPEIICFGLKTEVLGAVLNYACDLIRAGETIEINQDYFGFLEGFSVRFIRVEKAFYSDYVGYAGWFYESFDFPLLQLVWPDKQNKFPWESDFNANWKFKQPLLDRNTDFRFYEERNLGVYTTRQAFEGDPILYVYHNENGDWQFHTSLEPKLEEAKLVCLEEITKLDPTINEVYHLQYGWRAWRDRAADHWTWEEDSDKAR